MPTDSSYTSTESCTVLGQKAKKYKVMLVMLRNDLLLWSVCSEKKKKTFKYFQKNMNQEASSRSRTSSRKDSSLLCLAVFFFFFFMTGCWFEASYKKTNMSPWFIISSQLG